jgi:hypothetical protein
MITKCVTVQTVSSFSGNPRGVAPAQCSFHMDSHFEECSSSVSVNTMSSFFEQEYFGEPLASQALKYVTRAFGSSLF